MLKKEIRQLTAWLPVPLEQHPTQVLQAAAYNARYALHHVTCYFASGPFLHSPSTLIDVTDCALPLAKALVKLSSPGAAAVAPAKSTSKKLGSPLAAAFNAGSLRLLAPCKHPHQQLQAPMSAAWLMQHALGCAC